MKFLVHCMHDAFSQETLKILQKEVNLQSNIYEKKKKGYVKDKEQKETYST